VTELVSGISLLEAISVAFALAYLILAIRQNPLCWAASFMSAVLAVIVFADRQLFMQSALWAFFAAMAIYGWLKWTRSRTGIGEPSAQVRTWPLRLHIAALAGICIVSGAFAWGLTYTSQVMPLIDSFVTVASIVTTWMVAHKLLENWIYWFVIDCISIYLFLSQAVWLYAGLYVIYLVLVVIGYRQWQADRRRHQSVSELLAEPS
jgi:nicotinamide mononucleotide transporter